MEKVEGFEEKAGNNKFRAQGIKLPLKRINCSFSFISLLSSEQTKYLFLKRAKNYAENG